LEGSIGTPGIRFINVFSKAIPTSQDFEGVHLHPIEQKIIVQREDVVVWLKKSRTTSLSLFFHLMCMV